ncbi:MAG TPA: hypothetical protein VIH76_09125 [Candidatus Acidoferrales bacterium]
MNNRTLQQSALTLVLGLALAIGALARPAPAPQESHPMKQPVIYTYISLFGVPRANWTQFEAANKNALKINEGLVADGSLISWGDGALEVHEGPNAPTHVSWFSSMSVAGLMKALAAIRAGAPPSGEINYTMHADEIQMSTNYNGKPGAPGKYLLVHEWKPKAGHGDEMTELFNKHRKPDLDALVADGTINSYSWGTDLIHTDTPGTVSLAVEFPNAEAMDKFYGQITTMQEKNPLFGIAFSSATEGSDHRDHLLRIIDSGHK